MNTSSGVAKPDDREHVVKKNIYVYVYVYIYIYIYIY